MSRNAFVLTAGMIFSVVATLHALRLLLNWGAVIGGWEVPHWVSWVALALSGYLAYSAFTLKKG